MRFCSNEEVNVYEVVDTDPSIALAKVTLQVSDLNNNFDWVNVTLHSDGNECVATLYVHNPGT